MKSDAPNPGAGIKAGEIHFDRENKNMKAKIKAIGASVLGTAMLGATVFAPVAMASYALEDYPAPFIDNGNTNFLMVVGGAANPADVVGAINVAVRLGAESGEYVTIGTGGTVVTGGESKDVALDLTLSEVTATTLRANKLAGFIDTKVRWDSKDVTVKENLMVKGLDLKTSVDDSELGSGVFLGTVTDMSTNKFLYTYEISGSNFDYTAVADSSSKKLEIKFLNKNFEIIDVTNGTKDSITFKLGEDAVLGMGDTVTVDGTTVKINSIGSNSVSVTVGDLTRIIATSSEYDFGPVTVSINSILYTDDVNSRQVDLTVGSDILKTVENGDSMEVFGEPDRARDANWVWYIDADNADTTKLNIGALFNQYLLDHTDDLKGVGEYLTLPNNYAKVSINRLNTDSYADIEGKFMISVTVDQDENGDETTSYERLPAFVLTSSESNTGFRVKVNSAWTETDTVYILRNAVNQTIGAFENSDGYIQIFNIGTNANNTGNVTSELTVYYQDTEKAVTYTDNPAALAFTIAEGTEGNIVWDVDIAQRILGAESKQAEAVELTIDGNSIGTVEEDYRTQYGFIVRNPKSNGDRDVLAFAVPSEQVKATVIVEGPGSTSTTTPGSTIKKAVPIVDNIARIDTEVTEAMKQSKNLILVGGPAVNRLTAQALGLAYPSYGADSTVPEGAAMIKLVNDAFNGGRVALVVAGWDAENTRAACSVLQQFSAYNDLTGTAVRVSGTTTPTLSAMQ